ncbi:MAG: putative transporter, DctM subunit [Rhodospirillales bacterium]|nr:putative transporter, DctM subunit [Rhodospirillales bacterium]
MAGIPIGEILALTMFAATIFAVLIGYPVAFTLAGTALIFAVIGNLFGTFDFILFTGLASRYFGVMVNEVLVAVPLFIFMGVMLERSRIAEALLETMGQLFGPMRGGLGLSVIAVGALLAASTGIVGATVVTMGLLSLPAMLRAGYDQKLATGIICASGTLGQIIPPSTVLIFMADMLQGANQAAQQAKGNFSPDPVSVGDLFVGAFIPGFLLVGLYMLWVGGKALFQPASAPAIRMDAAQRRDLPRKVVVALLPPLLLMVAVLGSIIWGIASPTESASVGAVGAMLLAAMRRQLSLGVLVDVMRTTMKISSLVFVILLGASVFSLVFRGLGGERVVEDVLTGLPGGEGAAVLAVMLVMFLLGFFLDTFEIIFIMVPITAPVLLGFDGVNAIWLGVMFGVNLQTSFLTPPFGFSLFYLRGVAPRSVSTGAIYRGVIPFVALQLVALWVLWEAPALATWLPRLVYAEGPALEDTGDLVPAEGEDSLIPEQEEQPLDPEEEDLIPDEGDAADDLMPAEEGEDLIPPAEGEPGAEEFGVQEPGDDLIPPAEQ